MNTYTCWELGYKVSTTKIIEAENIHAAAKLFVRQIDGLWECPWSEDQYMVVVQENSGVRWKVDVNVYFELILKIGGYENI